MAQHELPDAAPRELSVGTWRLPRTAGTLAPRVEILLLSETRRYPVRKVIESYRPKQKIVRFGGREGRAEIFHYAFVYPDIADANPRPATAFQIAAYRRRIGIRLPEDATMDQVGQLLSAQEFARRALDGRSAPSSAARKALVSFAIGFISTKPDMRLDIRHRLRRQHEGGFDPFESVPPYYRPPKHITGIRNFADAVVADMRAAGALSFG
jgi:hypothetical protein